MEEEDYDGDEGNAYEAFIDEEPEVMEEAGEGDDEEALDDGKPKVELLEQTEQQAIKQENRITTKYMTKYERARILGTRALQISMNAPVMVDIEGETDPLRIAMKELREKKIPIIVRRYLPDGSYEDWGADELIVEDVMRTGESGSY
ncbi:unnamed protein product [Heterosigma akashiwo]|uniref:DNA-directed RNA polymerases I, II, and III subunit RPABC2 n=1 Tax=Heterosigma akashiwo TaxID=2829 RepID=A0A6S9M2J6_HETAK|mmetsp:Transcript_59295/g.86786  ORF Transcript_59295/g.86786 Transcript_59295/m.86786 type:complete len:147 (-) Transcript_59295:26-466(-)|eukprot:CAMPEP_0194569664 /NCGR_PEP_ID=MMETSP0292-20121207/7283_1 /TAXON_ID=39354 /ORGANISM="Heterosigma akashiwo, Strain CCMP2393" /LENGTH=146 /DNA_ID=CAMNT_0039419947 /DNA_START=51 /DNA_END=491 /DNA_ORIENTATION=+